MPSRQTISLDELAKLPYFDCKDLGGRLVPVFPCLNDDREWEIYVFDQNTIINIKGTPVEVDYFARSADKETDIYIEFLNFITKRAYWSDVVFFIDGIRNDIHNLGASLEKIDLFFKVWKEARLQGMERDVARFVSTELEYVFTVCRSLFDLLQEVISRLWKRVKLNDTSIKKRNLPQSFRKVVLKDGQLIGPDEIKTRYGLPQQLAEFYYKAAPFFIRLRNYRDDILHSGRGFDLIFQTERGFAIKKDLEPFSSFDIWKDEDLLPNNLASLRPLVAYVITETLRTCEEFAAIMEQTIELPPDIAPGYLLFLRGHHIGSLLKMKVILEKERWWE
jgi:hypothetical protein